MFLCISPILRQFYVGTSCNKQCRMFPYRTTHEPRKRAERNRDNKSPICHDNGGNRFWSTFSWITSEWPPRSTLFPPPFVVGLACRATKMETPKTHYSSSLAPAACRGIKAAEQCSRYNNGKRSQNKEKERKRNLLRKKAPRAVSFSRRSADASLSTLVTPSQFIKQRRTTKPALRRLRWPSQKDVT